MDKKVIKYLKYKKLLDYSLSLSDDKFLVSNFFDGNALLHETFLKPAKIGKKRKNFFPEHIKTPSSSVISLRSSQYGLLLIENILGEDPNDLRQRMTSPKVKG